MSFWEADEHQKQPHMTYLLCCKVTCMISPPPRPRCITVKSNTEALEMAHFLLKVFHLSLLTHFWPKIRYKNIKNKRNISSLLHSHPVGIPPTDKCNSKVHVREAEHVHPLLCSSFSRVLFVFWSKECEKVREHPPRSETRFILTAQMIARLRPRTY